MAKYIGIDIGGMSIKAGVVDETGKILVKDTIVPRVAEGQDAIAKDMFDLCEKVVKKAGLTLDDISGVGFGSPGTVDADKGVITFAANLGFKKFALLKEFSQYWSVKTAVGNDANCAALGETKFGGGKNKQNAFFVTLGTGVGTGFIVDGKILTGHKGGGSEGGHICIRMGGEKCSCGERGCWEAYASATGLIKQTEKALSKNPDSLMKNTLENGKVTGKTAFEAARLGDKAAIKVIDTYAKYVATGIVLLVNVFRPEVVMIGGGVSNAGDILLSRVSRYVNRHCFGDKRINPVPKIVLAELGNDAGIIGAASLVM